MQKSKHSICSLQIKNKQPAIHFYQNPKTFVTQSTSADCECITELQLGLVYVNQKKSPFNIIQKQSSRNNHEPFHIFIFIGKTKRRVYVAWEKGNVAGRLVCTVQKVLLRDYVCMPYVVSRIKLKKQRLCTGLVWFHKKKQHQVTAKTISNSRITVNLFVV